MHNRGAGPRAGEQAAIHLVAGIDVDEEDEQLPDDAAYDWSETGAAEADLVNVLRSAGYGVHRNDELIGIISMNDRYVSGPDDQI